WGLPPCGWPVMAKDDFGWLRSRAARVAALFDGCRVDHVVGYYRMWVRPAEEPADYVPEAEADQLTLGERLLGALLAAAEPMQLNAEDLGNVPDFVRDSLARVGIPGYRVLRWEDDDGVFRDPREYPRLSVATTGTHDTSTLATWWEEELDDAGRKAVAAVRV